MKTSRCESPSLRIAREKRLRTQTLSECWRGADAEPTPAAEHSAAPHAALYCVDLFCGMGGFSCGAVQAGHRIALAIDMDAPVVGLHRANHPEAMHRTMKLGPGCEEHLEQLIAQAVPNGARWHLHMSPPCQALSKLQHCNKPEHRRSFTDGIGMVHWCLRTVLRLRPHSWSLEEVHCRELEGALGYLKAAHPDYVDYAKVDLSDYGVGQTRTRMLAGCPATVQRFITEPSLRAPIPKLSEVVTVPEGAMWQRASVGKNPDPKLTVKHPDGTYTNTSAGAGFLRSVHAPAWTCTASTSAHAFLAADFHTIRSFVPEEDALLQTFPSSYRIAVPGFTRIQQRRAVGNAYPPLVACKFMQGAL